MNKTQSSTLTAFGGTYITTTLFYLACHVDIVSSLPQSLTLAVAASLSVLSFGLVKHKKHKLVKIKSK